jgi:hypothetical protein
MVIVNRPDRGSAVPTLAAAKRAARAAADR